MPDTRRAEILDGAVIAFGRNGYKRATLADVAQQAGVSAGTVSHYFGSKARLFEEVIAERLMPLVKAEEASLASHPGPMRDLLAQLLRRRGTVRGSQSRAPSSPTAGACSASSSANGGAGSSSVSWAPA